eukprot:gene4972-321_t
MLSRRIATRLSNCVVPAVQARCMSDDQGLNFGLTEQQVAMQDTARKFASEVMKPKAAEHDKTMEYPHEIFKQAWDLGLCNLHVPAAYGGAE